MRHRAPALGPPRPTRGRLPRSSSPPGWATISGDGLGSTGRSRCRPRRARGNGVRALIARPGGTTGTTEPTQLVEDVVAEVFELVASAGLDDPVSPPVAGAPRMERCGAFPGSACDQQVEVLRGELTIHPASYQATSVGNGRGRSPGTRGRLGRSATP